MKLLRTLAFWAYVVVAAIVFLPAVLLASLFPAWKRSVSRACLRVAPWGLRRICGLSYRVSGMENLPETPCLIASAQQSTWENMVFLPLFSHPATWIKDELLRVPMAGWVLRADDHIEVDRGGAVASVKAGMEKAREHARRGRSVLIFSEGTRNTVVGQSVLKRGTGALYSLLGLPCVPVVLNSGRFWPYKGLIGPGIISVEVLPALAPGLPRNVFEDRLKAALDAGTLRLAGPEPEG